MKITAIKTFVMDAFRTNWTFVKVETDEGLYGWGEASLGTQEGALTGCVEDLKRLIVGGSLQSIDRLVITRANYPSLQQLVFLQGPPPVGTDGSGGFCEP